MGERRTWKRLDSGPWRDTGRVVLLLAGLGTASLGAIRAYEAVENRMHPCIMHGHAYDHSETVDINERWSIRLPGATYADCVVRK